jgi:hypothetical protein
VRKYLGGVGKMKSHFPKLVDVEEWRDSYTGRIHKSSPGIKAEPLKESLSTSSVERRAIFLHGVDKPRRPDSEEKEAELSFPHRTGLTPEKGKSARQFFGQSGQAQEGSSQAKLNTPFPQAPIRNVPVKSQESLTGERELRSNGEGLKQPGQQGGTKLRARDSVPEPSERKTKQVEGHSANQEGVAKQKTDYTSSRAVQSFTPIQVQSKVDMTGSSQVAKDIVLDILMDGRGKLSTSKEALQALQDIALKMVMPISQKIHKSLDLELEASSSGFESRVDPSLENKNSVTKHVSVNEGAKGEHNFGEKEEKFLVDAFKGKKAVELFRKASASIHPSHKPEAKEIDVTDNFLTSDVQKAARTSITANWKDDMDEQMRVGTWAVHVLAGHMDSVPSELLRGMKPDAIKALGRLSLQILSASTKSAQQTSQPMLKSEQNGERQGNKVGDSVTAQEEYEAANGHDILMSEREVGSVMISKSAIKGSNDIFRMESVQGDLQALQNNLSLDFTADMLVEGFIEALKYDSLEQNVELRSDILTSTKFATQKNSSSEPQRQKSRENFRTQVSFNVESTFVDSDRKSKPEFQSVGTAPPVLETGSRRENTEQEKKKELQFQQVSSQHEEGGAWVNIPQSKFVES